MSTSSTRRHLRSAAHGDLVELRFRTTRYGKRSLAASALLIWNSKTTTFATFLFSEQFQCTFESWVVSLSLRDYLSARGVHGNGTDWDPMGPMGFPWEWESLWLYHGNGNGNGNISMGMGIKQWEWEWIQCSAVLANTSMLPKLYAVAR